MTVPLSQATVYIPFLHKLNCHFPLPKQSLFELLSKTQLVELVCSYGGSIYVNGTYVTFLPSPDCGQPDALEGTIVSAPSTTVGSDASYSCATGYDSLNGDESRICQENGTWTGMAPSCDVENSKYKPLQYNKKLHSLNLNFLKGFLVVSLTY